MGFQRKRKIYKLDFSGTEYDGLEVKVGGLTTGEYLELIMLSAPGVESTEDETSGMLKLLARHIKSWNLEEDGEPIPATFEGIKSNDLPMNMAIIQAWTAALAAVPEDTGKKSVPGDSPLLESIPSEIL
jgi:hypothetical protein